VHFFQKYSSSSLYVAVITLLYCRYKSIIITEAYCIVGFEAVIFCIWIREKYRKHRGLPRKQCPMFFRSKYPFKKHESNIYSSEKVCLQTLFFHEVSVHFYSLALTRNECMYALSVPFLVLLLSVSSSKWWTEVSSTVTIRDKKPTPSPAHLGIFDIMDDVRDWLLGVS
jgi:hypothetical protein